jgi:transposase-like protein
MAYRKLQFSATVVASPREAASEIVSLYERCEANQQRVAKKIGCSEGTLLRWIRTLETAGTGIVRRMEVVRARVSKSGVATRPPQGWHRRKAAEVARP